MALTISDIMHLFIRGCWGSPEQKDEFPGRFSSQKKGHISTLFKKQLGINKREKRQKEKTGVS